MSAVPQTYLDKAISWLAPAWGAKRLAWRTMEASYRSGIATRMSELYGRPGQRKMGDGTERVNLLNARDRGYQAYNDNPVAATLVKTETDNVIGDGLNYQPTTDSEKWNTEAVDRYYQWLEGADLQKRHSGCKLQQILWSLSRVAGDAGWIKVRVGPESFIQIVQSENIVNPASQPYDPLLISGIQFNSVGAPVSYWVVDYDERGQRTETEISYRDFEFLAHFRKNSQVRGESCFVTIADLLSHLDRYVDGVSLAAWMATVFGLIIRQPNAAQVVGGLDTVLNSQGNYQRAFTLENGSLKFMGNDGEVAQVQAHQPMQQTPEFIRAMFRMLGQPFDMPLEVIAKDMSTCTFASARIGLLPFYRACRIKAAHFAYHWSRTIQWWLSREKNRAPDDPKRWRSAWPENYYSHELLPNEWEYTDPVSEVQGDLLQVDAGFKSPQMVIHERGRNAQLIIQQRKDWQTQTEDLPTVHSTMTRDPAPEPTDVPPQGGQQ